MTMDVFARQPMILGKFILTAIDSVFDNGFKYRARPGEGMRD
jgi:hypothetical protein